MTTSVQQRRRPTGIRRALLDPRRQRAKASGPAVAVEKLVRYTQAPTEFRQRYRVSGGMAKFNGRVGESIGGIEILNARAHAVVLRFEDGAVFPFHPMDLFPVTP